MNSEQVEYKNDTLNWIGKVRKKQSKISTILALNHVAVAKHYITIDNMRIKWSKSIFLLTVMC